MKFESFDAWDWEGEFQEALKTHKPHADDVAIGRMRLEILSQFVDFIREIVSREFRLGLLAKVERLTPQGIVGRVDFANDRRAALRDIRERIERWGPLPAECGAGPILDRLLYCAEVIISPYRLGLGELMEECLAKFRRDGSIAGAVEIARPDGSYAHRWRPAPIWSAAHED
ncbi:hypothetical protein [Bradyrhizobium huanghuaihaiense]